jgi:CubicO group peptidase (beta-lactamase class C family)
MPGPPARLSLVGALLFAGCSSAAPRGPLPPPPVARWSSDGFAPASFADGGRRARLTQALPEAERFLAGQPARQGLPGLAVGVVLDGELVQAWGFGAQQKGGAPVDADTVFRIGSITKTFTSAAVLRLRDEGKLSLDAPAAGYLGEAGDLVYPTRDSRPFTLRELLTHGSGLPRLGDFDATPTDHETSEAEVLASLDGFSLENTPGTSRVYSNLGFSLLGLIVGRASGMRFRDYVTTSLLEPLAMRSTVWDATAVPPGKLAQGYLPSPLRPVAPWRLGAGEASGGLFSSVRDLSRYIGFELSAWPARNDLDDAPVRRASLRESHQMVRFGSTVAREPSREASSGSAAEATTPARSLTVTRGAGLGWQIAEDSELGHVVWHNGAVDGYSSALYMLPDRGVAVVALANVAGADMDSIADGTLRALVASAALPRRQLQPSAALAEGASRVAALVGHRDEGTLAASFYGAPEDLVTLRGQLADLGRRYGACPRARPLRVESGVAGSFALECGRGEIQVRIKVRTGRFPGLVAVRVDEVQAHLGGSVVASRHGAP